MKSLYFDVFSGASGDMILSSLLDLGVPLEFVRAELSKLRIPDLTVNVEKQKRSGIVCSHLVLDWKDRPSQMLDHGRGHRHDGSSDDHNSFRNPSQILEIIFKAGYPSPVLSMCEKIVTRLAQAEAAVHGVSVEEVHFHEIGAVDTIVDISGISLCLHHLGADRIFFSTLIDGQGEVHTRHGVMPVPVPAVMKLCEGHSLRIIDVESELLTPTGCAVLVALGEQVESGLYGIVTKTGYGCGDKVFEKSPNTLRVLLLETSPAAAGADSVMCLESDMDHLSGEIMADAAGRLMQAGALDVSWSPVFMKKGRPGYRLSVICEPAKMQEFADLIMVHTRTLGIRMQRMERVIARREVTNAKFLDAEIREKRCSYKGAFFSKPEYESLARLSEKTGRPIVELLEEYYKKPPGE